jgi:sterol desaturase/sphingolipid hydroxylase (fatty acid hydroxylase superfamily)
MFRGVAFGVAMTVAWLLQALSPHAGARGSVRINALLFVVGTLAIAVVCGACGFEIAARVREAHFGLLAFVNIGFSAEAVVVLLFLDAVSYLWHRANHRIRVLWRFHQVHHSDERFTVSTGVRFHPGELLLSLPVRLAAIALIGASPWHVLIYESVFTFSNLIEHGDISLPVPLERYLGPVLVLPAHHRWHHSRVPREMNQNFGTIFIAWDRLLGTCHPAKSSEAVVVGLPGGSCCDAFGEAIRMPLRSLPGRNGGPETSTSV